jgi:anti-anti-sigma factor
LLEHLDGQTTLAVEGEIDAANIDAFEAILDVVAKADTGTVIVDLTDLEFMDVRGINAMVRSRTTIESLGGSLVLRHPPPSVRRILEVLGPDMPVQPDSPEAGVPNGQQDQRRQAPPGVETLSNVIELAGTCSEGWEQALAAVVARASQGIRDLRIAELSELDVHIENGSVVTYRAKVKISFTYERDSSAP